MDYSTLKRLISGYLRDAQNGTSLAPSDFIVGGVDYIDAAINSAKFLIQKERDFKYNEITASLSIASTGTDLSAATLNGSAVTIKRVKEVLLPIAGGNYIPIELLTDDRFFTRLKASIGRQRYDSTATLEDLGIGDDNPVAILNGSFVQLFPADQFTFPVAAQLNAVRFLPDYTGPTTLTISGSGTAAINTDWEAFGTYNDRPFFFNYQAGDAAPSTVYALWHSGTAWILTAASNFGNASASSRYTATSTAELPVGLTFTATTFTGTLVVALTTGNVSTDFLLTYGWEYLQWQGILELNKTMKNFTERQEGNVDEKSVMEAAERAKQSLLAWDLSISTSTTTPELTSQ